MQRDTSRLKEALFSEPAPAPAQEHDEVAELTARLRELELKLRAIEAAVDPSTLRAILSHTRLICSPEGYGVEEVESPPPTAGETVERDGITYTVWRLGPSPFPGDSRRCAVLV